MEIGVRGGTDWTLSAMYDRTRFPARGMRGGHPGATGTVRTSGGEALHPKRQQRIPGAERVVLSVPGGGGYGDPLEREPRLVARDVYGVVLTQGERPGTYAVDDKSTVRRREDVS